MQGARRLVLSTDMMQIIAMMMIKV